MGNILAQRAGPYLDERLEHCHLSERHGEGEVDRLGGTRDIWQRPSIGFNLLASCMSSKHSRTSYERS